MTVYTNGKCKVIKDGTSYYRVMQGRKRVGSFLMLSEAIKYCDKRQEIAPVR